MKWANHLFQWGIGAGFYDAMTRQVFWRQAIASMLDCVTDIPGAPQVLDIGCGPGISTFALGECLSAPAQLCGLDLSAQMLVLARQSHLEHWSHLSHVRFEQGDAAQLTYADASFDLVFGHSLLYLVDDPVAVLREVKRVLKPEGQVVFMEPNQAGSLYRAAHTSVRAFGQWLPVPLSAARFGLSMAMWRVVSGGTGQMSAAKLRALFAQAGFNECSSTEALGSLGLHITNRASASSHGARP